MLARRVGATAWAELRLDPCRGAPSIVAQDPTIAYVFLRNSVFGPNGAASVELCVRDLVRHSRYAGATLVVCPKVAEPFEGVAVEWVPDVAVGGNLAKAWAVGKLLRRRGADVVVV